MILASFARQPYNEPWSFRGMWSFFSLFKASKILRYRGEFAHGGRPRRLSSRVSIQFFEQQLLGLFAHAGADLVNEFERIEELTAQIANW